MAVRGVMARLAAEGSSGDLDRRAARLAGEAPSSPVKLATVEVLSKLLRLAVEMTGEDTPTHLQVLVKMLEKGRPLLLEGLEKVPDPTVVVFMREIRDDIQTIIDAGGVDSAGTPEGSDDQPAATGDLAGVDQPS